MIIETIVDGVVYVEQRSFFVYNSVKERQENHIAVSTSDENLFFKHRTATFVNYLKNKLQRLVDRNENITIICGVEKTIEAYIIVISPQEEYSENHEVDEAMIEIEEANGHLYDVVFVGEKHNFELGEILFELKKQENV